jgi:hypothetical protein
MRTTVECPKAFLGVQEKFKLLVVDYSASEIQQNRKPLEP